MKRISSQANILGSEDSESRVLPSLAILAPRYSTAQVVRKKEFKGELWTSSQRQMHSLHYAVSYRGSFKPELPDFCIRRYSAPGDIVLDQFSGRGTTALQTALLGRIPYASDANPLAALMTGAKLNPAGLDEVVLRLHEIDLLRPVPLTAYQEMLSPFYHPDTYRELMNLRLAIKNKPDRINRFIELLALSRLHGHSNGFFSVYSFPQISIPPERQNLINLKRREVPEYRSIAPRIIKKASQVLRDSINTDLQRFSARSEVHKSDARNLHWLPSNSVDLIVTSPPFLDKVDYLTDNWLEFWFTGISPKSCQKELVICSNIHEWRSFIRDTLREALRVIKPNSFVVFEVGEVETDTGTVFLDEVLAEESERVIDSEKFFRVEEVLVNQQNFTKLSNCYQVANNRKGTNTNRLVVLSAIPHRLKRSQKNS
ncbi:MAG TPA: DNA methyltransferase [Oligoflexia bacterium]|nr:DNA methyltransferase [Oligoflexia bacterium]HMP47594.1 DNA methyltransferase [Oligoflexia bacterium]